MNIHYSIPDFMAKDLITFKPDTLIGTAIESILNHKISGESMVDENGDLVGILSEKDCLRTLFESSYYNNLSGHVKDYMSTEVITIDVNETLANVTDKFNRL